MPVKLNTYRNYLFAFLVIAAPLSFVPSIATPVLDFPSYRVGLYQIIALLFVAITVWPLYKELNKLFGANKIAYISLGVIAITALISHVFSGGQTRGALLFVSVIFLVVLLLCSWWYVMFQLKRIPEKFIKAFLLSGVFFAFLALLQLAWGTFADSGGFLCKGCKSGIFGFPRINATAAEPLFFANALLPVLMASFYLSLKKYKYSLIALAATTLAIVLTFSRGAYLAGAVGILMIGSLAYIHKKASFKKIIGSMAIMIMASTVAVLLLLGSATLRFYDTTPNITYNTLQSIAEHMTLGVVVLPDKNVAIISGGNNNPADDFESPGLIESSTNERLNSAELAIEAWHDNFKNIIIGTGLGNLGPYVVENISPSAPSNLTVYIFYILFLAELGLAGLIAFVVLLSNIAYKLYKKSAKYPVFIVCLGILVSFAVQYFFFGSYINVVYIWLWLGIFLGLLSNNKVDLKVIMGGR